VWSSFADLEGIELRQSGWLRGVDVVVVGWVVVLGRYWSGAVVAGVIVGVAVVVVVVVEGGSLLPPLACLAVGY
jgi:hypothetical protein